MSISSISDNSVLSRYNININSTNSVSSVSATESDTGSAAGIAGLQAMSADSASISKPGDLMAKLQKLKETDPDKFKEVCTSIAEKLSSAAESSGDTKLSEMADKFTDVANGGDISQLAPPKPPQKPMESGYSQDNQSSIANMGQGGGKNGMKEIMDSIFAEVDEALAA